MIELLPVAVLGAGGRMGSEAVRAIGAAPDLDLVAALGSSDLLGDPEPVAKAIGAGYLLLPCIGAWALIRELLFGAQTQRMARQLDHEGGLPVDDLPRTPAGRIVRSAADEAFPAYQAEVEADPENWRSWFRLSCAYDAAGDRKRARRAMREAAKLHRQHGAATTR